MENVNNPEAKIVYLDNSLPSLESPQVFVLAVVTWGHSKGYQTRQDFTGVMGLPWAQPKALPKASKFCTVPFTRHLPGE
jgi:hypothetical protein